LHLEELALRSDAAQRLIDLFGSSRAVTDWVVQNPELPTLLYEDASFLKGTAKTFAQSALFAEAETLLKSAISYTHALDRLRYLRQKWLFQLTLADLGRPNASTLVPASEHVWDALSNIADVLLHKSFDLAWQNHRAMKGLEADCPVSLVTFGKHGGRELNYSSDVDIVFVLKDGTDEKLEREATRFVESFLRAVSDRMGRGALYRVDVKLRPYGSAGPLLNAMRAFEAYYDLYAEPWERMALIRSRVLNDPIAISDRWEALRLKHAFRSHVSDATVSEILSVRDRLDAFSTPADFKRGPGGIRDIEFVAQLLQLVEGCRLRALHVAPTLQALSAIEAAGLLPDRIARELAAEYEFFRTLEHRCQLLHDRQTHELPESEDERLGVARMMGFPSTQVLETDLARRRSRVRSIFVRFLRRLTEREGEAPLLDLHPHTLPWLQKTLGDEGADAVLRENSESGLRCDSLSRLAPALVDQLPQFPSLTELIVTGEILDVEPDTGAIESVWKVCTEGKLDDSRVDRVGRTVLSNFVFAWVRDCLLWNREEFPTPSQGLSEALVRSFIASSPVPIVVIGLGSFARKELGPTSDLDLIAVVEDSQDQTRAEEYLQRVVKVLDRWKRVGLPTLFDFRLRPEGGKGLLAPTMEGLEAYLQEDAATWEKFALQDAVFFGSASGVEKAETLLARFGSTLTGQELAALLSMKSRIEKERVKPELADRDLKLGPGGLGDIEWLMRLRKMTGIAPLATEQVKLIDSLRDLLHLRNRVVLLGHGGILPTDEALNRWLDDASRAEWARPLADLVQNHSVRRDWVRQVWLSQRADWESQIA
jgi:glutamate-ammonia-ligase adenylyltransferase